MDVKLEKERMENCIWQTSTQSRFMKALDHPELPKIKLQYVKGHSGEKDNDRVDAIAVAFSKGRKIQLKDFVKE